MIYAARDWDAQVRLSRLQHSRVFIDEDVLDQYLGLVSSFRPPPDGNPDDPVITYLRTVLRSDSVLIDVGAGAGRLTVPASRLCASVIAIEPSPTMAAELSNQIAARDIDSVRVQSLRWEEMEHEPVDVVLMSHVLYGVAPIAPFIESATKTARDCVVAVLGSSPPGGYYHPLWRPVHGEDRIVAPGAIEFGKLLQSRGHSPEVIELPGVQSRSFQNRDQAIARSARRLRVPPGTPAHERLEKAVDMALVDSKVGTCYFRWRQPTTSLLFRWPSAPR